MLSRSRSCVASMRVCLLLACAGGAGVASAQPLTTAFTYQGVLKVAGSPAAGLYDLRFRLYDAAGGGSQVGSALCLNNVSVNDGQLTVQLDFGAQFAGLQRFLEIDVRADSGLPCANATGFQTLAPRQPLTAAPNAAFALSAFAAANAANASQLNGQAAKFYQDAGNLASGTIPAGRIAGVYNNVLTFSNPDNVIAGVGAGLTGLNASNLSTGTIDVARLPNPLELAAIPGLPANCVISGTNTSSAALSAGVCGFSITSNGFTFGVRGEGSSVAGGGVYGVGVSTSGANYGVLGETNSGQGAGVTGRNLAGAGTGVGVYGATATSQGTAVMGLANSVTGTTYGGHFTSTSADGVGAAGFATSPTATWGVHGQSNGLFGRGVFGICTNTQNDRSFGVYGQSGSRIGAGVYGENTTTTGNLAYGGEFVSRSDGGQAVRGRASSATGTTYGGFFTADSTGGTGVFASSISRGSFGQATGVGGVGVSGRATDQSGVGVRGEAAWLVGTVYGVFGQAAANGFGVFANGSLGASGSKSFRIDHPDDPGNRYLLHYSAESPEVINFYSGKVTLDASGEAVVELPAYFAKINTDPRYSLTAVGSPMPLLHVAEEIDEASLAAGAEAGPGVAAPSCRFKVAGGVPGGKVSWRVEAVRHDLWARRHGAPVETAKEGVEKGTYQHPELYGQPPQKATGYREHREPPSLAESQAREGSRP